MWFIEWTSITYDVQLLSVCACALYISLSVQLLHQQICHFVESLLAQRKHVYLGWNQSNYVRWKRKLFRLWTHLSLDTATAISIRTHCCRHPRQTLSSSVCHSPVFYYHPPFWRLTCLIAWIKVHRTRNSVYRFTRGISSLVCASHTSHEIKEYYISTSKQNNNKIKTKSKHFSMQKCFHTIQIFTMFTSRWLIRDKR